MTKTKQKNRILLSAFSPPPLFGVWFPHCSQALPPPIGALFPPRFLFPPRGALPPRGFQPPPPGGGSPKTPRQDGGFLPPPPRGFFLL